MIESLRKKSMISVIGTSTASPEVYETARSVGRLLAEHNCVVVCGGRGGVMEAVCLGASEAGGFSVALLPGAASEANPYASLAISTGLGEVRNVAVVSAGSVVISVGGAFGTLSEIGFALKMGKPVVALETWEVWEPHTPSPLILADSPEEAVKKALTIVEKEGEPQCQE